MIIFNSAYKAWNSHKLETLVPPIHEVGASYVHQLHLGQNSETSMPNKLCAPTQLVGDKSFHRTIGRE